MTTTTVETIGSIANNLNEIFEISLPTGGMISNNGQYEIQREICNYIARILPDAPSYKRYLPPYWDWHAKVGGRGEYVGSFCKRAAKYYYQEHGIKFDSDFLGRIGGLVGENTTHHKDYIFDYDDRLDWQDGDFGDDGSCFWSCHKSARFALRDYGAYAIRFYEGGYYRQGIGRAWIVPQDDKYFCFNAYGDYELPEVAQVLSAHLGLSYRRIDLTNYNCTSGDLYINSGRGYALGSEPEVNGLSFWDFGIDVPSMSTCAHCDEAFYDDDLYRVNGGDLVCESCLDEHYSYCDRCEEYRIDRDFVEDTVGDYICDSCADDMDKCAGCDRPGDDIDEDHGLCESCLEDCPRCTDCGDPVPYCDLPPIHCRCAECKEEYRENLVTC